MDEVWFKSSGYLRYGSGVYIVVDVDQNIAEYYKSLMPKHIFIRKQKYDAHISVATNYEKITKPEYYYKYNNELIDFEYSNKIDNNENYFWLNVRCKRVEEIRLELGLNSFPPWDNGYHITIGNKKEIN